MAQNIELKYVPREQFFDFHNRKQKRAVMVCHRRSGKTVAAINELVVRALHCPLPRPVYAYCAPFRSQAKKIAWEYLKDYAKPLIGKENNTELTVQFKYGNKPKIILVGLDNYDAIRGQYLDGVIVDEFQDVKPGVWTKVILPMLSDRKGWSVCLGTPKGRNQFYDLYRNGIKKNWFTKFLPADKSGVFTPEELADIRNDMEDEEAYKQEFLCDFNAIVEGVYYSKQLNELEADGRLGNFPYRPEHGQVHCSLDIGISDDTAIWWYQEHRGKYYWIDYYENRNEGAEHYIDYIKEKPYLYTDEAKGWSPYFIHLPHDAFSREFTSGRTVDDMFRAAKMPPKRVPSVSKQQGINAARKVLKNSYFNKDTTEEGYTCLLNYQREWDEERKCFGQNPRHDWSSHGADSFRYGALSIVEQEILMEPEKFSYDKDRPIFSGHNGTFNDLLAAQQRRREEMNDEW